MKYKAGLVVGRFQPFHKGHLHLIKKALEKAEKVIVAVGSANVSKEDNPFSFEERKKQIAESLKKNKLDKKIMKIVPVDDHPDDDVWLRKLVEKVGKFNVAFGNNEWTNGILEKAGYPVIRIPFHKRHKYEGTKIRNKLKLSKGS